MVEDGNAVYISFNRGEDTIRHSFLSHLYAELQRRSISCKDPASDDDHVIEENDAGIKKSKISLVILSEEFATSKWCRDELMKVCECRGSNDLVVVPVFYGVTESVFRKEWLPLEKRYDGGQVDSWRKALQEIADLPGHTSSHERSDSDLVGEIVADVRQKLDLTGEIGVYSRVMKIENLLSKQPWGVRSLGIWGMGGVGKTTIAKAAFKQLSGDFDASCFIDDFDNAFQEKGVYGLLEEHLSEKIGISSGVTRDKLRHSRILLVLDDVWKPLGATTFLGGFDWLGSGSLVIVTSRDRQVLVQCRVNEVYEVNGLNDREAMQLLSRCAFGKDVPPDRDLLELSMKLVSYANGNPLALSIYGGELKGRPRSEMQSVVLKLKENISEKIFNVFKKSYDALSDSEKEIFLHIVIFYWYENVENVMQLLAGCGFFPRVGIDVLVDKCLVTISEKRVKTHNLIRKVGHKIIRDQTEETGVGYRFFDASNIQSLLEATTSKLGNEDIKAIILDKSNLAFEGHITFQQMYNLRYLKIQSSNHMKNSEFRFPVDSQYLPPELRILHWSYYPLQSFPQEFDVQHLVELYMPCSKLKKLWGGTKNLEMLKRITLNHSMELVNVDELQYSRNIEIIDLQGCPMLKSFPDMGRSLHLRDVNLSACKNIKIFPRVSPSITDLHLQGTGISEISSSTALNHEHGHVEGSTGQVNDGFSNQDLGKLVFLNLKDCSHLRSLPDMATFESLEVLDLYGCSELEEIQGFPQTLKKLCLSKTAIRELPSSIGDLDELTTLDLKNCKRLRHLPVEMKNLKSLEVLDLSDCAELEVNTNFLPKVRELHLPQTGMSAPAIEKEEKHAWVKTHGKTKDKFTWRSLPYRFLHKFPSVQKFK